LPLQREPAVIADRTRSRNLAAQRFGKLFGKCKILLLLDASADGDNDF
jgi:hypothetical protein